MLGTDETLHYYVPVEEIPILNFVKVRIMPIIFSSQITTVPILNGGLLLIIKGCDLVQIYDCVLALTEHMVAYKERFCKNCNHGHCRRQEGAECDYDLCSCDNFSPKYKMETDTE